MINIYIHHQVLYFFLLIISWKLVIHIHCVSNVVQGGIHLTMTKKKPGSALDKHSNYRPISNLYNFKRASIFVWMYPCVCASTSYNCLQSAYCHSHSYETVLIKFITSSRPPAQRIQHFLQHLKYWLLSKCQQFCIDFNSFCVTGATLKWIIFLTKHSS